VDERICIPSERARGPYRDLGYIAADSLDAADRVVEEIRAAIRALVPFPQSGHRRPDLTSRPIRFQVVRDFLVGYTPDDDPLVVLAVLHGGRSPRVMAAILRERK